MKDTKVEQARIRIDAMCPSILVSGGGNFPVRKKERQNARRSSHMERYEKVMGIKRRIASIGTGGIQAGDPNALEKLEAKAKRLEDRQDMMKRANAHYRKHGTRERLKANGFRWSPKNGAWQRQLTDNARRALKALEA